MRQNRRSLAPVWTYSTRQVFENSVGRTGFEPVTSSVSECRSGASGQDCRAPDLLSCPAGRPAGPQRFPCIYPAYPGRPRATVGPAPGPLRTPARADGPGRVRGRRRSFWTISPPSHPGAPSQRLCGDVRSSGIRMLGADGCASGWVNRHATSAPSGSPARWGSGGGDGSTLVT